MPGPKKKIDKTKRYKETSGEHIVSEDGSYMKIGGSLFKRTVLPSVAAPQKGDAAPVTDLDELDAKTVHEQGNTES